MPLAQFSYKGSGFLGDAIIRNILLSVVLAHTAPHPRESLGSKGRYTGWAHLWTSGSQGTGLCAWREEGKERTLEKNTHTQKNSQHQPRSHFCLQQVTEFQWHLWPLIHKGSILTSCSACLAGSDLGCQIKKGSHSSRDLQEEPLLEEAWPAFMTTVGEAPAEICSPSDSEIDSSSLPGLWLRDTPILTFLASWDFNKMVQTAIFRFSLICCFTSTKTHAWFLISEISKCVSKAQGNMVSRLLYKQ